MKLTTKVVLKSGKPHNIVQVNLPESFEEMVEAWGEDLVKKLAVQAATTNARNHAASLKTKDTVIVYDPTDTASVTTDDDAVQEFLKARGL